MGKAILFTGGAGDILAIESFLTDIERNDIEVIFYATRAHILIKELLTNVPTLPNIKDHIILWDNWKSMFAFHNKQQTEDYICKWTKDLQKREKIRTLLRDVVDYSIAEIFPQIMRKKRHYTYSSMLKTTMADISKFNLPECIGYHFSTIECNKFLIEIEQKLRNKVTRNYVCICPYSTNDKRDARRDFNTEDWKNTFKLLEEYKTYGIVLNTGNDSIPDHPRLFNLSNKTTMKESIEILKESRGYFGIDSALSVLAAKLFHAPWLIVKSSNNHLYIHARAYYAPQTNFDFIRNQI